MTKKLLLVALIGAALAVLLMGALPNEDGAAVDNGYPVTVQRSDPDAGYPAPVEPPDEPDEPAPVIDPTPLYKPPAETALPPHSLNCQPDDTGAIVCK